MLFASARRAARAAWYARLPWTGTCNRVRHASAEQVVRTGAVRSRAAHTSALRRSTRAPCSRGLLSSTSIARAARGRSSRAPFSCRSLACCSCAPLSRAMLVCRALVDRSRASDLEQRSHAALSCTRGRQRRRVARARPGARTCVLLQELGRAALIPPKACDSAASSRPSSTAACTSASKSSRRLL